MKPVWEVKLSGLQGDAPGRKGWTGARTALCSHGLLPACEAIVQMGGRPRDSRIPGHSGIILEHRCGRAWPRGGPGSGPSRVPALTKWPRAAPASLSREGLEALAPAPRSRRPPPLRGGRGSRAPCGSRCPSEMRAHLRPRALATRAAPRPASCVPSPPRPPLGLVAGPPSVFVFGFLRLYF